MLTRQERREKRKKNRSKMIVSGRGVFNIIRIKINKANV